MARRPATGNDVRNYEVSFEATPYGVTFALGVRFGVADTLRTFRRSRRRRGGGASTSGWMFHISDLEI